MAEKRKYDSTVARIAGNIASGIAPLHGRTYIKYQETWEIENKEIIAAEAVALARMIVAEVERTEPELALSSGTPKETT